MDQLKNLKEIENLLNILNGVTVVEASGTKDRLHILLTIESHESHLMLVHCGEAANVRFHCNTMYAPGSEEANSNPARALLYRYHANSPKDKPGKALDDFNWLGAFLVCTMYRAGDISGNEEKRLAKVFNAVSKSN